MATGTRGIFIYLAAQKGQPGDRSASIAAMHDRSQIHTSGKKSRKTVKGERDNTKTDIIVPVVRVVVVADRSARIVFIVVPRAAAQTL